MKISGAAILIEELIRQGVETVFGYPGGYVLDIYDELHKNAGKIRHILTAGEPGAAFAADAYARVSGKTGVIIATGGPGATNLVTGIACAHLDSVPVVYITGNVAVPMLGQDSFQDIDIVGVTLPIVKHSYVVKDIQHLQAIICEAFHLASTGRKGPVHIDIPKNIQIETERYDPDFALPLPDKLSGKLSDKPNRPPDLSGLDFAVKLIEKSKRPFIYCGGGVTATNTGAEIIRLSEMIEAPIGMSLMGIGSVPQSHAKNLGMGGMHGKNASIKAMSEADLIIAAGVRFSDRATGSAEDYAQNTAVIHMDIDPAEIGKNIRPNVSLCGDLRELLPALLERLCEAGLGGEAGRGGGKGNQTDREASKNEWTNRIAALKAEEEKPANGDFTPQNIVACVNSCCDADTVVTTDVGQHQMWVAQHYKFEKPRTLISSGGLGAMGYGLGAAIGASLAKGSASPSQTHSASPSHTPNTSATPSASPSHTPNTSATPGAKTILFTGDGSFGMNMNELATAVSLKLPITIVLLNNNSLGMVRQWQTLFFDSRHSNTTLDRKTDFPAVARAFGAEGCEARTLSELRDAIEKAPIDKPCLIECKIDIDELVLPHHTKGEF